MKNVKSKQLVDHHVHNSYEILTRHLEDAYPELMGQFTIRCEPDRVSVRAAHYIDYLLVKSVLKKFTTKEIEWSH